LNERVQLQEFYLQKFQLQEFQQVRFGHFSKAPTKEIDSGRGKRKEIYYNIHTHCEKWGESISTHFQGTDLSF
jgi:hypothetical protein